MTDAKYALSAEWKEQALKRVETDRAAQKDRQRLKEQQEQLLKEAARKDLKEWLEGGAHSNRMSALPIALRVKPSDPDTIETTRGAEVPKEHARKLWSTITAIRLGARPAYQRNGHSIHIGLFTVDHIDTAGNLRAGCHMIQYEVMEALAIKLGWKEDDSVLGVCTPMI